MWWVVVGGRGDGFFFFDSRMEGWDRFLGPWDMRTIQFQQIQRRLFPWSCFLVALTMSVQCGLFQHLPTTSTNAFIFTSTTTLSSWRPRRAALGRVVNHLSSAGRLGTFKPEFTTWGIRAPSRLSIMRGPRTGPSLARKGLRPSSCVLGSYYAFGLVGRYRIDHGQSDTHVPTPSSVKQTLQNIGFQTAQPPHGLGKVR